SASFTVIEQTDKLGAKIGESFLPDLAARKKFAAARVPKLVDISLDELLSLQPSKVPRSWSFARRRSTTPAKLDSHSKRDRSWTRSSTTSRGRSESSPRPES